MVFGLSLFTDLGLLGLLIITFLAFTILPIPVEAAIIVSTFAFNPILVLIVALIGSTLGSITTYYIGLKGIKDSMSTGRRAMKYMGKARELFEKYGGWRLLLFGWLPFIGDPLILIAGSFGMKFWKFLVYSFIGRLIYFILVIYVGISIEGLF